MYFAVPCYQLSVVCTHCSVLVPACSGIHCSVLVPARSDSEKLEVKGVFPGAIVMRSIEELALQTNAGKLTDLLSVLFKILNANL